MKSYQSIPTIGLKLIESGRELPVDITASNWIGFDKLDGSLIRAEWNSKKKVFYKLGRKNGLLDDSNPILLEAPNLVEKDYAFLYDVFTEFKWSRVVAFFEFLGKHSFAGTHEAEDHTLSLVDLSIYPKGLVDPKELLVLDTISNVKTVHKGPVTPDIIQKIHEGRLPGVSLEGVVFKRMNKKGHREMFKTKSYTWYNLLKKKCGKNDKLFERLK